jgi:ring-1,2-phenylacetyl-CoA epoxidase subunit PaaD
MVANAATPPSTEAQAWAVLDTVTDPEIPVLSVVDLGLVRHLVCSGTEVLEVGLALTYSGCPATLVIRSQVASALRAAGLGQPRIVEVLSPPWSSDWLGEQARQKLQAYGIAPPVAPVRSPRGLWRELTPIGCPRCNSADTEELSRFGSTPCKALHRCRACLEPFEYFKCI